MSFTALHRAVGAAPGPITDGLLDAVVDAGAMESHDLDWKAGLPPTKNLPSSDFPKDIAAMANNGGGIIVYGVREEQKSASERVDVGELTEGHERTLRSAAFSSITPPVFGLKITRLGTVGNRALAIEVPGSIDGPHLVYNNDFFGAPVRNDSDTVWMKEPQIAAMYRARFDAQRNAHESLDRLYSEVSAGYNNDNRAWLVAVAQPRIPHHGERLSRDEARAIFPAALELSRRLTGREGVRPLENVDLHNPRPGLRRWVAPSTATDKNTRWRSATAAVLHNGGVTLAYSVGGQRAAGGLLEGGDVMSTSLECGIADIMALLHVTAAARGLSEYELRIGIECDTFSNLRILRTTDYGELFDGVSTPLSQYIPIDVSVRADMSINEFLVQVNEVARDCINQGGLSNLRVILPPAEPLGEGIS